ncbi:MAG: PAS domain S-box protein [ANME-2 cluster archaeon]|nr:PAS domain S-box protein [ANME-2 cluster archaeon]
MTLKNSKQESDTESLKKHISLIYDTLTDMIFLLAVEPNDCFRFESVNQTFLSVTGLTREQVIGKRIEQVLPETVHSLVISKYKEAIVENKTVFWDQTSTYPTGEIVCSVTVTPVRNAEGVCTHLVGSVHDLTERKQAEDELRLHAAIMDNIAEGIYLIGLDDNLIKWTNEKFERMFGYDPGEMVGKQVDIVNAPTEKTPTETRISIMDVLKETGEWHGEVRNIKRDGTHFWCYANVSTFDHPEYGEVILSVHTDITERKKAEKALHEREIGYNVLFDNANDLIQKVGPDGKILLVNKKWLETLEYSEEEAKDLRVTDIIRKDQIAPTMGLLQGVAKGENVSGFETIFITKNGKEIYVEGNGNGIFKDGKFISAIGIFRDITERKRAEEEIKKFNVELEQRVKERTAELEEKNQDLEIMNKGFVGRELRMIELKKRIAELEKDVGETKSARD